MIPLPLPIKPLPPIEEVAFSFEGVRLQLSVQRNDLIHPLISGNKWRKLQAFLTQDSEGMQSFGGAWSNHLLAVAALGRMLHKPTIGWIRGEENRSPNHYERWLRQLGMRLHYLTREEYKDKSICHAKAHEYYPHFLIIPEGAEPQPNFLAFDFWLAEIPTKYTHCLLSCGSGATLLGLCHALRNKPRDLMLLGIHAVNLNQEISRLHAQSQKIWPNTLVSANVDGKRFGKISEQRTEIARAFFKGTGIAPDPLYDASVLLWYYQAVKEGRLPNSHDMLWLHSGGITGWAGFESESHKLFSL